MTAKVLDELYRRLSNPGPRFLQRAADRIDKRDPGPGLVWGHLRPEDGTPAAKIPAKQLDRNPES